MKQKHTDCESCAFYKVEEAICDMCGDAEQWEPEDTDYSIYGRPKKMLSVKQKQHKELICERN